MDYELKLDRFQIEAIDLLKKNNSVLISAPTGAGKTLIAEYIMHESLKKNDGVIYTSPIKALSNQKFRDFSKDHPGKTGIVTGDVSINPFAPLLIMTTEIFRNRLFHGDRFEGKYSWIIFDEIHYLDNPDRGTVWEESLMFLPKNINFIGLSATLSNIDRMAAWIEKIHGKPVSVVIEKNRPVPLKFYFISKEKIYKNIDTLFKSSRKNKTEPFAEHMNRKKKSFPSSIEVFNLISSLKKIKRLPAIYFTLNRRRTTQLAERISTLNFLTEDEKKITKNIIRNFTDKFDLADNPDLIEISNLLTKGIAFHHAGMIPQIKEIVESLFSSELIKIVFATETFALGINMPARSVIFDELKKRIGRSFKIISKRDFFQMAGRAGRRGKDKEGYIYSFVDRSIGRRPLKSLLAGEPEPVTSRFDLSYAGILNLYDLYEERLTDVFLRSFKYFQIGHSGIHSYINRLKGKLSVLKELRYINKNRITEAGKFASEIHGYELPVTELWRSRLFEKLNYKDLIYITLALVYEPSSRESEIITHKRSQYLSKVTHSITKKIKNIEKKKGVGEESNSFNFQLSEAVELWIKNESFYYSVFVSDRDPGDLVRYFRMTSQILRELRKSDISEKMNGKLDKALNILNRDIIDPNKELNG